jgi:hypothetical protein
MSITDMACGTSANCLVVGGSGGTLSSLGVARTTDGGRTWSAGVDSNLLQADSISCARAEECFVVGFLDANPPYRLIATRDDGRTWRHVAAAASADTGAVACTISGRCTTGGTAPVGRVWFAARPTRTLVDAAVVQPTVGCGASWCAAAIGKHVTEFRAPGTRKQRSAFSTRRVCRSALAVRRLLARRDV